MATDSIFRLMQLFEQGRIALHEPISTYLPEFADPKVAVVKDWQVTRLVTADREITVHDLLTMTAGMTNTWWHRVCSSRRCTGSCRSSTRTPASSTT